MQQIVPPKDGNQELTPPLSSKKIGKLESFNQEYKYTEECDEKNDPYHPSETDDKKKEIVGTIKELAADNLELLKIIKNYNKEYEDYTINVKQLMQQKTELVNDDIKKLRDEFNTKSIGNTEKIINLEKLVNEISHSFIKKSKMSTYLSTETQSENDITTEINNMKREIKKYEEMVDEYANKKKQTTQQIEALETELTDYKTNECVFKMMKEKYESEILEKASKVDVLETMMEAFQTKNDQDLKKILRLTERLEKVRQQNDDSIKRYYKLKKEQKEQSLSSKTRIFELRNELNDIRIVHKINESKILLFEKMKCEKDKTIKDLKKDINNKNKEINNGVTQLKELKNKSMHIITQWIEDNANASKFIMVSIAFFGVIIGVILLRKK